MNRHDKLPHEILATKASQAGQANRFEEIIENMSVKAGVDPQNQQNSAAASQTREALLEEKKDLEALQASSKTTLKIIDVKDETTTTKGKLGPSDFEVIEQLGKGSFGSVYLVRKNGEDANKYYAMKILEKKKVLSDNLLRYAKTERNVLSLASHQFVVGLNFAFQSNSRLYLIMDYAPGGDMGMALANHRRFPVELVRVYAAEIVLALEYLHS